MSTLEIIFLTLLIVGFGLLLVALTLLVVISDVICNLFNFFPQKVRDDEIFG